MHKPASAPDVIPPRPIPESTPVDEAEGSNVVQHRPNPKADPATPGDNKYKPRSPYRSGND